MNLPRSSGFRRRIHPEKIKDVGVRYTIVGGKVVLRGGKRTNRGYLCAANPLVSRAGESVERCFLRPVLRGGDSALCSWMPAPFRKLRRPKSQEGRPFALRPE